MITYIRKGKERKELTMGKKLCESGQVSGVYEIIVYPSSSKGFIQLNAEKRETVKGKKEAFLAYYRILNGYRKDGWEVEEIKG